MRYELSDFSVKCEAWLMKCEVLYRKCELLVFEV